MKRVAAFAVLGVMSPVIFGQSATDSPAAVAAKARQEAIKSVEFEFTMRETVEAGGWNVLGGSAPGGGHCPPNRPSTNRRTA